MMNSKNAIRHPINNWNKKNNIEIQAIDWIECDEIIQDDIVLNNEDDIDKKNELNYNDKDHNKRFVIFCFGVSVEGHSVCIKIKNYNPYFYVKIPSYWNERMIEEFKDNFLTDTSMCDETSKHSNEDKWFPKTPVEKMGTNQWKTSINTDKIEVVEREIFWSFMNKKKFKFFKLYFNSRAGMKLYHQYLKEFHEYNVNPEIIRNIKICKLRKKTKLDIQNENDIEDTDEEGLVDEINDDYVDNDDDDDDLDLEIHSEINSEIQTENEPKIRILKDTRNNDKDKDSKTKVKFKLFESDLEPLLRFFHDTKIQPSNWLSVAGGSYNITYNSITTCQINIETDWNNIKYLDKTGIPPIIVASFDIECDSSHGDFPIAKKDTKKLANELVICYLRDDWKMKKYDKDDLRYIEVKKSLAQEELYFRDRILQALNLKNLLKTDHIMDDGISRIYFKDVSGLSDKVKGALFKKMCKSIHFICNRPIRKVKANKEMKDAIKIVKFRYNKLEEKNILEKKTCNINDYIEIIKKVSYENNIDFTDLRDKLITKEILVNFVNQELRRFLPAVAGDTIIQIGTVFWRYGDPKPFHNSILSLKDCNDVNGIKVESFKSELALLIRWTELIKQSDPDILVGYNIFGFDEEFMYQRILELTPEDRITKKKPIEYNEFINMGRLTPEAYKNIRDCRGRLVNKKLSSSALGDNYLNYFNMPGRVQIDLLKVVQSSMMKLPSYKLDNVAEFYIGGKVEKVITSDGCETGNWLKISNIKELEIGNYIIITMKETGELLLGGRKLFIKDMNIDENLINVDELISTKIIKDSPQWGIGKDDISPKDIFRLQKGTDDDRAIIAKYCIQDCVLVIRLLRKLETISNNFGMSNVCLIPFSFVFLRGQGIKIFSLITNECSNEGFVLPVLDKIQIGEGEGEGEDDNGAGNDELEDNDELDDDNNDELDGIGGEEIVFDLDEDFNKIIMTEDSYEGAIVLDPKPNFYKDPISILDFGSLYPSEMMASNLSHDSLCEHPYWLGDTGAERLKALGYGVIDRTFDNYVWIDPTKKSKGKVKSGFTTARFVQFPNSEKGLIPRVLQKLLKARKAMKKLMEAFEKTDPGKAVIYEGLQLAYKLTANSLYGQIGAKTSKIYKSAIAASTTAGGRERIIHAKNYVLEHFKGSEIVYGDTDSIFVKFDLRGEDGVVPTGREAIERAIKKGIEAEHAIQPLLPAPHVLEYEKVFYPLMLITKKRYAGDKYEFDPEKSKFTSMGIVLKRRDNAPILKYIYGGVIKILMKEMDIEKAVQFVKDSCYGMLEGKFDINMFVISKTLKDYYKDPESIAHKVLADRMADRDPGNKPASNERIQYAYIKPINIDNTSTSKSKTAEKVLQGDKIEHIGYIQENNLKIDYSVYIENQLIKPISQMFELVVENLKGFPYKQGYFDELKSIYNNMNKFKGDKDKIADKISDKKLEIVYKLIFHNILVAARHQMDNTKSIDSWFIKQSSSDVDEDVVIEDGVIEDIDKNKTSNQIINPKLKQLSIEEWGITSSKEDSVPIVNLVNSKTMNTRDITKNSKNTKIIKESKSIKGKIKPKNDTQMKITKFFNEE